MITTIITRAMIAPTPKMMPLRGDNFPGCDPQQTDGPISAGTGVGSVAARTPTKCYAGVRHVFLCLCTVVRCGIRRADSMSRGGPGGHD